MHFYARSQNVLKWNVLNFCDQKGKISFQFPHSESSLDSEFLLCLWYQKDIWSHRKTFWKIIQNEKCWTFQKLSDRKSSEFWAVACKRSEFFITFFKTSIKVHWTFTPIDVTWQRTFRERGRRWCRCNYRESCCGTGRGSNRRDSSGTKCETFDWFRWSSESTCMASFPPIVLRRRR